MYDYNSKFDVEKHKETFVNYCEVIITPDGEIHYAQPSHNHFLERYGAERDGTDVDTFVNKCPAEWYFDYHHWLVIETKCVSCRTVGYVCVDEITEAQYRSLKMLIEEGLVANRRL